MTGPLSTPWAGPGSRGEWIDPLGGRHWLYDSDEPMTRTDGRLILVRVVHPSWVALFEHRRGVRHVLVSPVETHEPYDTVGWIGQLSSGLWELTAPNPANRTGSITLPSAATREEAIQTLIDRYPAT